MFPKIFYSVDTVVKITLPHLQNNLTSYLDYLGYTICIWLFCICIFYGVVEMHWNVCFDIQIVFNKVDNSVTECEVINNLS